MKLPAKVVIVALSLPFVEANSKTCVTSFDEGNDYFPDKAEAQESQYWSVSYENSYKIARNLYTDTTYLLYQCGTDLPQDQLDQHDYVLPVPIGNFGLASTPMLPFIELLGKRMNITAMIGNPSFLFSPCLKERADESMVEFLSFMDATNTTAIEAAGIDLDLPFFIQTGMSDFTYRIQVSEFAEDYNLAVFEWIKFFSLFFNLESEANAIFENTKDRYECVEKNAAILSADADKKPTVLWGSWSEYCGGWSVAKTCPEYYCEFAEACGATLLKSEVGSINATTKCGAFYMTTDEFVEHGKDADHWIYTSPDVNSVVYSKFKDELQDFVSVKSNEVYDTEGGGQNSWFEQRIAEPGTLPNLISLFFWNHSMDLTRDLLLLDAILQDFCLIVGTENWQSPIPHTLTFLRHVDDTIPSPPICTDPSAPLETLGTPCVPISDEGPTGPPGNPPTDIPGNPPTLPPTDSEKQDDETSDAASLRRLALCLFFSAALSFQ
eukprot:scaffold5966_cov118-Cylindrotheca_fusiformis.AAC.3